MKFFSTKSVSSDPNDMPLSTLIENNNESIMRATYGLPTKDGNT